VLGGKHSPGLVDGIIDDVFARYDPRTCTVAVAMEELYLVSACWPRLAALVLKRALAGPGMAQQQCELAAGAAWTCV
jgi:hypothetical protein